jgi:DNA modification methylase
MPSQAQLLEKQRDNDLLSINEASKWASDYLGKKITTSNISYLIQYAKVRKYRNDSSEIKVNKKELKEYYDKYLEKQKVWKKKLGEDLNWNLSFDSLREAERTKHVHRLHPYKGKFIPQLVEYFLDDKTDNFKTKAFFKEGDIVLDPFMGSGTTLVQASELGMHSIGIDITEFNCLISKVKLDSYRTTELADVFKDALEQTRQFSSKTFDNSFDNELKEKLSEFNKEYFPNPEFKFKVLEDQINEKEYGYEKLEQFFKKNGDFLQKNGMKDKSHLLSEKQMASFLTTWFSKRIRQELFYYIKLIQKVEKENIKNLMKIILSRTARSCRATTHSDLATLKQPQFDTYYCHKHKKLCAPINSILKHLQKNTYDTIERVYEFSKIRKPVFASVIHEDARKVDIFNEVQQQNPQFYNLLIKKKIDGVFTSPPYVGQIDYHEQHAYAYELFEIKKEENLEIGTLKNGQGEKAREEYIEGISNVLLNIRQFVKDNGNFFIVANDKFNLYPVIAQKSNLEIVNQFKRPVLHRTERDRQPYAEIIFHMKKFQK